MDDESERASYADTPYSRKIRTITLRHVYYCPDCERERTQEQADEHYAEVANRANPELIPGHKPATDSEWREWREATTTRAKGKTSG